MGIGRVSGVLIRWSHVALLVLGVGGGLSELSAGSDPQCVSQSKDGKGVGNSVPFYGGIAWRGTDLRDAKLFDHNGTVYVLKPYGGLVSMCHDGILRAVGLMLDAVPPLHLARVAIEVGNGPSLDTVVGQMRERVPVTMLSQQERATFLQDHWKPLLKASMLGVGISDITGNPHNLVRIGSDISVIDGDGLSFPVIPYRFLQQLGISKDEIQREALAFVQSDLFQQFRDNKETMMRQCSGSKDRFYRRSIKSFNAMVAHLVAHQPYDPSNYYFGNVWSIALTPDGRWSVVANVAHLDGRPLPWPNRKADNLESPLLCEWGGNPTTLT